MRGLSILLVAFYVLSTLAANCGEGIGKCKSGYCCSKYGYCGTGSSYCGKGCQSEFGICDSTSTKKVSTTKKTTTKKVTTTKKAKTTTKKVTTTKASTATKVSTNGRCGASYGVCPDNECCSKYNYCGTSDDYCGKNCQSEFGRCEGQSSSTTKKATTTTKKASSTKKASTTTKKATSTSSAFKYHYSCINKKHWALTFDDGTYIYDKYLLDLLKEKDVKATFFVNGDNFGGLITDSDRKSNIKRMYNEGHVVASHTWRHIDIKESSESEIRKDMTKLDDALYDIIGKKPAIMRLPYGSGNGSDSIAKILKSIGFNSSIMWNVDTKDYDNKGDIDFALKKFSEKLGSSIISLNHCAYSGMSKSSLIDLVSAEIDYMLDHGYTPVTIDECIGLPAYRD